MEGEKTINNPQTHKKQLVMCCFYAYTRVRARTYTHTYIHTLSHKEIFFL